MNSRLAGRVAFVTLSGAHADDERAEALAGALIASGAIVVLVADDAEAGGRVAAALGPGAAVFCPGHDVGADVGALVELAAELAGPS